MILRRSRGSGPRGWMVDRLAEPLDPLGTVLFESPDSGLLAVDRSGHVVRANAWLRRYLHASADPRVGAVARDLFVPEDRGRVRAFLNDAAAGAQPAEPLHARMPGADGGVIPVRVTAQPLREPDRAVSGLLLRIVDESGALRLRDDLAHGQKLQAIGQLAAGIAHDFNGLLTAVIGSADAALARDGLDDETQTDLRRISAAGERGAALVRQILAFSRRQPLQPRVIAVNEAVRTLADLLPRMLGTSLRIVLALEEPGRGVRVDPTQFDQILINLAMNARDAMPEGGTLTLRTGHRTLYRAAREGMETIPPGRYVLIEASDTGVGIAPDVLPRIFEPFFTTRRHAGGSGLGLSTVHGIVRQSDGFVTVQSSQGAGTTVRIFLPRHAADIDPAQDGVSVTAEAAVPAAAAGARADGHRVVLLVEDDAPVRQLAERALTRAGWTVVAVASAEAALAMLEPPDAPAIDLLVSDIILPGMDGSALLRALRARGAAVPAILVSGYADSAIRGDLPTEGVVFLPKPYALKALVAAADAALLAGVPK